MPPFFERNHIRTVPQVLEALESLELSQRFQTETKSYERSFDLIQATYECIAPIVHDEESLRRYFPSYASYYLSLLEDGVISSWDELLHCVIGSIPLVRATSHIQMLYSNPDEWVNMTI